MTGGISVLGAAAACSSAEETTTASPPAWPKPRSAWYAVFMLAIISMMSNVDRGVVSLLVQPIKRDLHISDTGLSIIIGFAFSFFYMLVGLPISRVADIKSRKLILTVGLSLWSLATTFTALAQNFMGLFIARGIVGAAESTMGPSAMSMISDLVPRDKLPRAMSIYSMGIMGGMAGSMIIGGLLLAYLSGTPPIHVPGVGLIRDWQMVFFLCGIPGLFLAVIFRFTVREPPRRNRKVQGSVPIRDVAGFIWSNKAIYVPMFLSAAINSIEGFGLGAWRVAFYERSYGWVPGQVGPLLGIISLVAMPIGLILGTLFAEHLNRKRLPDAMLRLPLYGSILAVPLAIAGPLMPTAWLALLIGALGGVAGAIGSPGSNSAIQIITPNEMRSQTNALFLFTISVIGGGVGPTVVALVTDFAFQDETMLRYAMVAVAAVLGPIGIILTWITMKPYGRAVTRVFEEEERAMMQQQSCGSRGV